MPRARAAGLPLSALVLFLSCLVPVSCQLPPPGSVVGSGTMQGRVYKSEAKF